MKRREFKKTEGRVRYNLDIPGMRALQDSTIKAIHDAVIGTTIKNPSKIGIKEIYVSEELWSDVASIKTWREMDK